MESYPAPARARVAQMIEACAREPHRAVAFQGAPGANSHIAVEQAFPDALPMPCFGFEDALDAVSEGRADCALIPIENSLHGRVADIHFLLPESGLVITGEHFMPIRYALMGLPGGKITEAMSHPQALGQCRKWLRANGLKPVAYPDTAGAAAMVVELGRPEIGAIAPPLSADLYGHAPQGVGPFMTTFIFEVKNVPAALYKALGGFATNGVNMTKLESYQRGASFAATEFYCDIEGHPDDAAVGRALEELKFHTKWMRLLGVYPQARPRTVA
jgi:prephenate dehydratase